MSIEMTFDLLLFSFREAKSWVLWTSTLKFQVACNYFLGDLLEYNKQK